MPSLSERDFYLQEFRGRTLVLAADRSTLRGIASRRRLRGVLDELLHNGTNVVLVIGETRGDRASDRLEARTWLRLPRVPLPRRRGSGRESRDDVVAWGSVEPRAGILAVWQALRRRPLCLVLDDGPALESAARVAEALRVHKLVLLDPRGGLLERGSRRPLSFLDENTLDGLLLKADGGGAEVRRDLLTRIERALAAGVGSVNLCRVEGLADELFSYEGSGTYFSRGEYCHVGRLRIDDFREAEQLIARGQREGLLKPRGLDEVGEILLEGFGAWVGTRHLAGIAALSTTPYVADRAGEVVALYTITRFQGEGLGLRLVRHLVEEARLMRLSSVFAVTTSDRAAEFFSRSGFEETTPDEVPAAKWEDYDLERRGHVRVFRLDL
jgi:amino-acid N-acetyltransferase